jgi:hypothetical protein
MFACSAEQSTIESAEGRLSPKLSQPLGVNIMNAKEVKAALADEAVQVAIKKEVAKAVKEALKSVIAGIKEVA